MSDCKNCERLREVLKEISYEVNRRAFGGGGTGLLSNLPHVLDNILNAAWSIIQPKDKEPSPNCQQGQKQATERVKKLQRELGESAKLVEAAYQEAMKPNPPKGKCELCGDTGDAWHGCDAPQCGSPMCGYWEACPNGCKPPRKHTRLSDWESM